MSAPFFMLMDEFWLEGLISVQAALASPFRAVEAVYVRKAPGRRHAWRFAELKKTAVSQNIPLHQVKDSFFEAQASGSSHGGVMAKVGPRQFLSLAELIEDDKRPFVVMMDGVEDPFNFGQAIRSLYAAGVSGVVVRPRNWTTATAVVARASAGAIEMMPMAIADSAEEAADFYQAEGLTVACTAKESAIELFEADLTQPLFVLIGGEKRGITRSFLNRAQLRFQIPYKRPFEYALGTTSSAAVLAFERMRQLK